MIGKASSSTTDQLGIGSSANAVEDHENTWQRSMQQQTRGTVENDSSTMNNSSVSVLPNNGVTELQHVATSLTNGYVHEYSCQRFVDNGDTATTLPIYFDYEFAALADAADMEWPAGTPTLDSNDPIPTLPPMEWGTLWSVANALGLHGCSVIYHPILNRSQRRLGQVGSSSLANYVVSLSSSPTDSQDPSGCEYLPQYYSLSANETCYAMHGMMLANFTGNNSTAVADFLQGIIRIKLNSQQVLTGGVTRALYLGKRENFVPSNVPAAFQDSSVTSNKESRAVSANTTVIISCLSFVAALTAVVAGLFLARHRRRDRVLQSSSSDDDKIIGRFSTDNVMTDEEIPTCPTPPGSPQRSIASFTTLPTSNVTGALSAARSDDSKEEEEENTQNDSHSETSSESTGAEDALSSDANSEAAVIDEKTEVAHYIPSQQITKVVDVLPPLPPTKSSKQLPASAQQAVRRRRKRKKKKKVKSTITRVNSRENIKEMETIAEATEEDVNESISDDDGSEIGSEYSCSTDDSDHPSRDPSPVRSEAGT